MADDSTRTRYRARRKVLVAFAAAAALVSLATYFWLRPYPYSYNWWLSRSVAETHVMQYPAQRTEVLRRVSELQASNGSHRAALATVGNIRNPKLSLLERARRLAKEVLARFKVSTPPPPMANVFFEKIDFQEAQAYAKVVEFQAKHGKIAEARKTIEKIDNRTVAYGNAMLAIATALAEQGDIAAAEATATEILSTGSSPMAGVVNMPSPAAGWAAVKSYEALALAQARAGNIKAALQTAADLPELVPMYGRRHAGSLRLAVALALVGDGYLEAAEVFLADMNDERDRGNLLLALVAAHAGASRFDSADAAAGKIEDGRQRAQAQVSIAGALAQAKRYDDAAAAIEAIEIDYHRSHGLQLLCEAQAAAEDFDAAMATLEIIREPTCTVGAKLAAARHLARAGRFDDALGLIDGLDGAVDRITGQLELAQQYDGAGLPDERDGCIEQAIAIARGTTGPTRRTAMRLAVSAQARAGGISQAIQIIEQETKGCRFGTRSPFESAVAAEQSTTSQAPAVGTLPTQQTPDVPPVGAIDAGKFRLELLHAAARAYALRRRELHGLWDAVQRLEQPIERANAALGAAEGLLEADRGDSN